MPQLLVAKLVDTPTPKYATEYSAGMDIHAVILEEPRSVNISPQQTVMIRTGLKMLPEPGFHIELFPRSGLAYKVSVNLANCVGVIDRDYQDEVKILLHNEGDTFVSINHGERIAQMQLKRTEKMDIIEVAKIPSIDSSRDGGFGSTGK